MKDHKPAWGPVGEMGIDWRGQIAALRRDGYDGWISLETHWTGPNGDKFEASTICGRNLRRSRELTAAPRALQPCCLESRRGFAALLAGGPGDQRDS